MKQLLNQQHRPNMLYTLISYGVSLQRHETHGLSGGKNTVNNWVDLGLRKGNPMWQGSEEIECASKDIIEIIDLGP